MEKREPKKENEMMDGILTYLLTLASTENVLQSIKEVLTLHASFNPFTLFNYISQNNTTIIREHLIDFLAENGLVISDELARLVLHSNGFKEKLSYTEFLNYVYPVNAQVLREISTNQIKKYSKTEKTQVNEEVLCCFLMLLDQEIEFIRTFQDLKKEQPIHVTRDRLKKVFKTIKKASEKQGTAVAQLSGQGIITHVQLRSFIKLYHKVQDHQMLNLGRRLSMGREGLIGLDEFDFWLKPWRRQKSQDQENSHSQLNSSQKGFLQKQSRKPSQKLSQQEQTIKEEHFVEYISKFLNNEQQLDQLKSILVNKIDFDVMSLFKQIDSKSCGVIGVQDIQAVYECVNGESIPNLPLLISKYSTGRGVLSFSQFSQIYRLSSDDQKNTPKKFNSKTVSMPTLKLALQIIRVNIEVEEVLQDTWSGFSRDEIHRLFQTINQDNNGFISYQQLKGYLASSNLQLSMGDLMSILRRFDKNKNGVIVEEDFVKVLKV